MWDAGCVWDNCVLLCVGFNKTTAFVGVIHELPLRGDSLGLIYPITKVMG